MSHTPGPWHHIDHPSVRDTFDGCSAIFSEHIDDAIIATIGEDVPGHEANARLIAAAPELLEALKDLHHAVCVQGATILDWHQAEAAIAKATGGAA